jgi:leucyl aminopeptidase
MEFETLHGNPAKQRTACLVLGAHEGRRLSLAAKQFDDAHDGYLSSLLSRGDLPNKVGQTLLLMPTPKNSVCERVLLVDCGQESEIDDRRYHQILASMATVLGTTGASNAVSYLTDLNVRGRSVHWKVRRNVEICEETLYRFEELKSKKDQSRPLQKIILGVANRRQLNSAKRAVQEGLAIASGVKLAKDLSNLPANICTPTYLAECAQKLGRNVPAIKVNILEKTDIEKLGMGSLLAVCRGSAEPPKLIILDYRSAPEAQKPIVLLGKGVTFDSGGISLKPRDKMDEMKFDMCGAASVLGTLRACAELELPLNITAIIPAVENMPGSRATKPGDVVTSLSGQTIEILNTDAEGRLILCDCLTYSERYDPDAVIDIATLTGACIIALGHHPHGLLSNHRPLAQGLLNAGHTAADPAWELPLWDEYQEQLDSKFADMANVGGRDAGAITAACFLSRFARKFHWAHLDIAGTAWKSGKATKGATGRPVPLLTQYLLDRAAEMRKG